MSLKKGGVREFRAVTFEIRTDHYRLACRFSLFRSRWMQSVSLTALGVQERYEVGLNAKGAGAGVMSLGRRLQSEVLTVANVKRVLIPTVDYRLNQLVARKKVDGNDRLIVEQELLGILQ